MSKGIRVEHQYLNGIEQKWCPKCDQWLSLDHFAKDNTRWDKLRERCKECRKLTRNTKQEEEYLSTLNNFLSLISESGLPHPEVVGSLSDSISFEWRSTRGDEFVVTVKLDCSLVFSGVFSNGGTIFGVEKFDGKSIPKNISDNILSST